MGRVIFSSLAISLVTVAGWAQTDSRLVLGGVNEYLAAGSLAIRAGRYNEGIRLTFVGLEMDDASPPERSSALANVCAAHAALGEPDPAIERCTESIAFNGSNWRAYSNRAYAYYLKELYADALRDLDAAAAIAPSAPQVLQIRAMINERTLRPRVTMEDRR